MDPRKLFIDERLKGASCVYCGLGADSRDHVPPKILLDDPFPENLPVVDACAICNEGFSLDEQYLACFLECVLTGSTNSDLLSRPKIKRILNDKIELRNRIQSCCRRDADGRLIWTPEIDRVRNVVVKLARGHAAYELGTPQLDPPDEITILPLVSITDKDRAVFENAGAGEIRGWPEVGSRAFLRAYGSAPYAEQNGPWISVQPYLYRYTVDQYGGVRVQIVLAEYLACLVDWHGG